MNLVPSVNSGADRISARSPPTQLGINVIVEEPEGKIFNHWVAFAPAYLNSYDKRRVLAVKAYKRPSYRVFGRSPNEYSCPMIE